MDSLHFINDSMKESLDATVEAKLEQEKWRNQILFEKSLNLVPPKYILY